jgi:hypothetical protein
MDSVLNRRGVGAQDRARVPEHTCSARPIMPRDPPAEPSIPRRTCPDTNNGPLPAGNAAREGWPTGGATPPGIPVWIVTRESCSCCKEPTSREASAFYDPVNNGPSPPILKHHEIPVGDQRRTKSRIIAKRLPRSCRIRACRCGSDRMAVTRRGPGPDREPGPDGPPHDLPV